MVVMALIFVGPLLYSLWMSLQGWDLAQPLSGSRFVGFENYSSLLSDSKFWWSLGLTLGYTALVVAAELLLGLALALLLSVEVPYAGTFRALIIVPMMMTPIVAGLCWKLLLDPAYGVINYFLGTHVVWLGRPGTAFVAVAVTSIWQNTPYVAILLLAGLQSLSDEPFEAAAIDGASRWQMFWYCTLPLLRPIILVAVLIRTIFELRSFDNVYILTGGGPADATMLLSIFAYLITFVSFDLGLGAAASWIMLLVTALICAAFIMTLRGSQISK
jgi:multiple sugar transport system permease protein